MKWYSVLNVYNINVICIKWNTIQYNDNSNIQCNTMIIILMCTYKYSLQYSNLYNDTIQCNTTVMYSKCV